MNQIVTTPYPANAYASRNQPIQVGTTSLMTSTLQNQLNVVSLNLTLRYDDAIFQQLAIEGTHILQKIERGQVDVYSNKSKGIINPTFIRLMCLLREFNRLTPLIETFKFNSYLTTMIIESLNIQHAWNHVGNHLPDYHYYLQATHTRLVGEMIKGKAGLNYQNSIIQLKNQYRDQRNIFESSIKKYGQLNCLFIEIPYIKMNGLQLNLSEDTIERKFVTSVEFFCTSLKNHFELKNKLTSIQWRIIKSLDRALSAHLLVYITGDEYDYLPLIRSIWPTVCIQRNLNIEPVVNCLNTLHSYVNNGIVSKQWLAVIRRYESPLEFYRYKANGISFEWKSYTGNFNQLKLKE
ncbi:hypothetical protein EA770_18510 [Acinetobacter baumannii]|nr:hypothetical protein EA770_18510 [Acinetobacter baumannii]